MNACGFGQLILKGLVLIGLSVPEILLARVVPWVPNCTAVFLHSRHYEMESNIVYDVQDAQGKVIGWFKGEVSENGRHLRFAHFNIGAGHKGQGHSKAIVALLLRDYPHLKKITASFIEDNMDVFANTYYRTKDKMKAMRATPFYKVFSPYGFKKVDFHDSTFGEIYFDLMRD